MSKVFNIKTARTVQSDGEPDTPSIGNARQILLDAHVFDNVLDIALYYPQQSIVDTIEIDQCSVRASDSIRITYDYERDGWSILQASVFEWDGDDDVYDGDWQEVAFVQAWGRALHEVDTTDMEIIVEKVATHYKSHPDGGSYKRVLTDGNLNAGDVAYCFGFASARGDIDELELGGTLMRLTQAELTYLYSRYDDYKAGAFSHSSHEWPAGEVDTDKVDKVVELVRLYYAAPGNITGGSLHIVLDDGNLERCHLDYCLGVANGREDESGTVIGTILVALTAAELSYLYSRHAYYSGLEGSTS